MLLKHYQAYWEKGSNDQKLDNRSGLMGDGDSITVIRQKHCNNIYILKKNW